MIGPRARETVARPGFLSGISSHRALTVFSSVGTRLPGDMVASNPVELPTDAAVPPPVLTTVSIGSQRFQRAVIRTPWVQPGCALPQFLTTWAAPFAQEDDLVVVTEKVVVVALERAVAAGDVTPGRLALLLAERVKPVGDSRGLSIPVKMQYVIDHVGRARVLAATLAAALTRPLRLRGAFYVVAGDLARSLDGMRPPYHGLLLPPLDPEEAASVARHLAQAVGRQVAIVDVNDRGGSIRAVSGGPISARLLLRILHDNPLGQRDQSTPVAVVRVLPRGGTATPHHSSGVRTTACPSLATPAGAARSSPAP